MRTPTISTIAWPVIADQFVMMPPACPDWLETCPATISGKPSTSPTPIRPATTATAISSYVTITRQIVPTIPLTAMICPMSCRLPVTFALTGPARWPPYTAYSI